MAKKPNKTKIIEGLNFVGERVAPTNEGALYQVVEGDPTNDHFVETIQQGAQEWAEEEG